MHSKKRVRHKRWTSSAISNVLKLLKNYSLKQTAEILGCSYKALIEALRRNQISPRGYARYASRTERKVRLGLTFHCDVKRVLVGAIRGIADLKDGCCSWPIGETDSEAFRFCNARRVKKSYCARHYQKAYEVNN